jgi:hypothetical protein
MHEMFDKGWEVKVGPDGLGRTVTGAFNPPGLGKRKFDDDDEDEKPASKSRKISQYVVTIDSCSIV